MTENVTARISAIRREMGDRLLILGHHYQRAAVFQHADETGDSLELARTAASRRGAERIVFCGVRFMAESADILSHPSQTVYMPEMAAGCPMARMATTEQAEMAWDDLSRHGEWLPVVYVNSTADIKAFCGRRGGSTCTSSNAARVFEWVLAQKKRILFLPDEHLGVNTGHDLGIPDEEMGVYDPSLPSGGLTGERIEKARVIVWRGFCIVHMKFSVEHIRQLRHRCPGVRVIVHPEAPKDVVRLADAHGSTSQIVAYVAAAPDDSTIAIGTELNLVERLALLYAGRKRILALSPSVCANMAKTNERSLLALLEQWSTANEVHVPDDVSKDARLALDRMLQL